MTISKTHFIDLVDGRFAATNRADLSTLIATLQQDAHKDNIVVHMHGGMVTRESAHRSALKLIDVYREANAYPIFLIWNSDFMSVMRNSLDEIAQEKIFKQMVRRVAQFVVGKFLEGEGERGGELELDPIMEFPGELEDLEAALRDQEETAVGSAASDLSESQEVQAEKLFAEDTAILRESQKIANGMRSPEEIEADIGTRSGAVKGSTETLMSAAILKEIAAEAPDPEERGVETLAILAKFGVKVVKEVMARYKAGRDHGLYTTIVEEVLRALYLDNLGILTWNNIKKDTADAFDPTSDESAGTALLAELQAIWQPGTRITLVGHSTGAVYIGNFLAAADKVLPPEAKFDVVLMAAACTFPFMHKRLDIFKRRVNHIRNFALSDKIEGGYWEVPVIYNKSILYLLSGLLEEGEIDMPMVGMERYFKGAGDGPYDREDVNEVVAYIGSENVWAPQPPDAFPPGHWSTAANHIALHAGDDVTLDSLRHIVQEGF